MPNTNKTNIKTLKPLTYILLSIAAAILLVIANSAVWFNNYIFDSGNFTKLTTQAIEEESSRTALATEITDRLLEKRPALKGAIDEPMIKLTSGLLNSNAAQTALDRTISQFQVIITSKNPQDVSFDLSSLKQTLSQVLTVAGNLTEKDTEKAQIRVEDIPNTITIIDVDNLPNIYTLGVVLLWVAPIATLIAAALLIYLVYRARYSRQVSSIVLAVEGGILLLAGLFALALGPIFKPPILANVPNENMRTVVENIYQVFIDKFNQQASIIFVIAILLLLASVIVFWAKPIAARITKK